MDTEFINLYIAKQKALIDDLQSRLLLSETKAQLLESKLSEANKKVEQIEKKTQDRKAESA